MRQLSEDLLSGWQVVFPVSQVVISEVGHSIFVCDEQWIQRGSGNSKQFLLTSNQLNRVRRIVADFNAAQV
jgi:hypothetical protein